MNQNMLKPMTLKKRMSKDYLQQETFKDGRCILATPGRNRFADLPLALIPIAPFQSREVVIPRSPATRWWAEAARAE